MNNRYADITMKLDLHKRDDLLLYISHLMRSNVDYSDLIQDFAYVLVDDAAAKEWADNWSGSRVIEDIQKEISEYIQDCFDCYYIEIDEEYVA